MILDGVADRDAVMALSAMTASPLDAVQHPFGGAALVHVSGSRKEAERAFRVHQRAKSSSGTPQEPVTGWNATSG